MLPLFVCGHFVVGGGDCPFFFFGALLGAFCGVRGFLRGGGDEAVDGEEDEECVEGTIHVVWLVFDFGVGGRGERGTYSIIMLIAKLALACMQ